jgi:hypothetical protein
MELIDSLIIYMIELTNHNENVYKHLYLMIGTK